METDISPNKGTQNIIFILFSAWFITAILYGELKNDNSKIEQSNRILNDSIVNLNKEFSVIDNLYQLQSQANLRILNVISNREQRKLANDSIYLDLAAKIYNN